MERHSVISPTSMIFVFGIFCTEISSRSIYGHTESDNPISTRFPDKFHETCMSGAPPVNPLMEFHEECIIGCSWCRVVHISHTPYMLVYAYYEGLLLRPVPVSLYK